MKREIIALILIITVIVLTYAVTLPLLKKNQPKEIDKLINDKVEYDKLLEVRYNIGGGMSNIMYEIDVNLIEEVITETKSIGDDTIIYRTTYKISEEDITYLDTLIKKYNFLGWKDLPLDEENIALDDTSISLYFKATKDNKNIVNTISYDSKIPEGGRDILSEYTDYISSLLRDENKIDENSIFDGYEDINIEGSDNNE